MPGPAPVCSRFTISTSKEEREGSGDGRASPVKIMKLNRVAGSKPEPVQEKKNRPRLIVSERGSTGTFPLCLECVNP